MHKPRSNLFMDKIVIELDIFGAFMEGGGCGPIELQSDCHNKEQLVREEDSPSIEGGKPVTATHKWLWLRLYTLLSR